VSAGEPSGAVATEDLRILASIIAERGTYEGADRDLEAEAAARLQSAASKAPAHQASFFDEAEDTGIPDESTAPPEPPSEDDLDELDDTPVAPYTGPPRSAAAAPKRGRRAPDPEQTPWHYTVDLSVWSRGFATTVEAKLHARERGCEQIYLGKAEVTSIDPRLVALSVIETLGYRVAVSEKAQRTLGKAMTTIASRVLGPPFRISPEGAVDLSREWPTTFDALEEARTRGDYVGRPLLLARDLAHLVPCAHDALLPLVERYDPDILVPLTRELLARATARADVSR